jgi:DNA-binding MarR family transcriptional regulator
VLEKQKSSNGNQSVARALAILNLLASRSQPLGVREIARQLSLAPSIAQRLIKTLARRLPRADRDRVRQWR